MKMIKIVAAAILLAVVRTFTLAQDSATQEYAPKGPGSPVSLTCTATFHTPEEASGFFSEWLFETTWKFAAAGIQPGNYYGRLIYAGSGFNGGGGRLGQEGVIANAVGNLPPIDPTVVTAILKSDITNETITARCGVKMNIDSGAVGIRVSISRSEAVLKVQALGQDLPPGRVDFVAVRGPVRGWLAGPAGWFVIPAIKAGEAFNWPNLPTTSAPLEVYYQSDDGSIALRLRLPPPNQ